MLVLLLLLSACTSDARDPAAPAPPVAFPTAAPVPPTSGRFAASWLLVAWAGAEGSSATRTEAEARALASSLHNDAAHGADFAALARRSSDHPSGRRGGWLGAVEAGTLDPAIEAAIASVQPGQVGPVVRLPTGYAVVRRDPLDELHVAWAEWTWKGARGARATRSHTDARQLAADAADAWRAGEPPAGADVWTPEEVLGRLQWPVDLDARVARLRPGEISEPLETPWGVLVVRRLEAGAP